MKTLRLLVLLALAASSLPGTAAAAAELRGMWVCPWDLNSPDDVGRIVDDAARYNFNALFYEVRYRGDALYVPNKRDRRYANPEPRSPHLSGQAPDFDPLEELVARGHDAGLEVHAWVTAFVVLNKKTPTPDGHPAKEHPDWLSQNGRGDTWDQWGMAWLEPALPEVQDYLYDVFMDIVVNYDVDGLHLDYVRYPSPDFGRHPGAIARYQAETGKDLDDDAAFADWRRAKIGEFINRLYEGMAAEKPTCRLTSAVFASRRGTAYNSCLQDWTAWLSGSYVDAVMPMAYGRDAGVIRKQIGDAVGAANGRHVYAGIMVPEVPADKFDAAIGEEMALKARAAREAGAEGVVVFSYSGSFKEEGLVARAMKEGVFAERVAPPEMPWKREIPLAVAGEIVNVRVKGEPKYAVRIRQGVPHRYAYLLAKEISSRVEPQVYIDEDKEYNYRVYVGCYDERSAAAKLREKLAAAGY
ncbi:MAG: family 10 glycosylhydrolase [Candidatus Zixiibacteriota bacterium]